MPRKRSFTPDDPQLYHLLDAIQNKGTIGGAARISGLSYRSVWALLVRAEADLGMRLVEKQPGAGKGTALTAAGRELLTRQRLYASERAIAAATAFGAGPLQAAPNRPVLLASTIGPVECGLVEAMADAFAAVSGLRLRALAAGSGQALDIAREGRVDLVLSHAPDLEQQFVAAGYGSGRYPLMYNDFLLLGPSDDPAEIRGLDASAACRRLAASGAPFASRGDRSGTHLKERALWDAAGVQPGPGYAVCPDGAKGSLATLRWAAERRMYLLVDRAAWLSAGAEHGPLPVLVSGDAVLRNQFALVPVSPRRIPHANTDGAAAFVAWATGPDGQALIAEFGRRLYGQPLFFPEQDPEPRNASHP